MHSPADRGVFIQSLRRTVDQAVRRMFRMLHTHEPFQLPLIPIDTNPPPGRAGHISTTGFLLPEAAAKGVTPTYSDKDTFGGRKGRRHTPAQIWAYASAVRGFHEWFAKAMTHIEVELYAGIQKVFRGPDLMRALDLFRYCYHQIDSYKLTQADFFTHDPLKPTYKEDMAPESLSRWHIDVDNSVSSCGSDALWYLIKQYSPQDPHHAT